MKLGTSGAVALAAAIVMNPFPAAAQESAPNGSAKAAVIAYAPPRTPDDKPDGRLPAVTPEAQKRQADRAAERRLAGPADGPESRALPERCILWPTAGPPMMPSFYNSNYQIAQGPGYVMIMAEMIHDVRFTGKTNFRGTGENLKLVERFSRSSAERIQYEYTVDDASTFSKPWRAEVPITRNSEKIYEYACHEGNYAMTDMLLGARLEESKAAGR